MPERDFRHGLEPNDISINPSSEPELQAIIDLRLRRRDWLCGALACGAGMLTTNAAEQQTSPTEETKSPPPAPSTLTFTEIEHGLDQTIHVAPNYRADVVLRWGDPIIAAAPPFEIANQSAAAQEMQFGYNNDFLAFLPLPRGSQSSDHGLLCVNHEYTIAYLMFPGLKDKFDAAAKLTREQVAIELAAHGHSAVEIRRTDGQWKPVANSPLNRRLTMTTEMRISGPAAGDERLQTSADPGGALVLGTLNNCAGGVTPWGTVLTAEENFDTSFGGKLDDFAKLGPAQARIAAREKLSQLRLGMKGETDYAWSRFEDRFRLDKEPLEPNRFGWIVEYDPYDPASVPVKRTALGRCKHEGCTITLAPDRRVVAYVGDDSRGEYLYRFVSNRPCDPRNPAANRDLLDDGTLFVARLTDDGRLQWLPLIHGADPLTAQRGFRSQADVLIDARLAGDAVRATPLDRPEDIEVHASSGRVLVMLTNNSLRTLAGAANPRAKNIHGHILELQPPAVDGGFDHAAEFFTWDLFLLAGDPQNPQDGARYHSGVSANGWLSCPDNCAIDPSGRLWIATDGAPYTAKMADGVYATDVIGPGRALTKMFFRAPTGAELTGICFTPDGSTLFVSVQHPGDEEDPKLMTRSTFDAPSTRWPDFDPALPPRPSVVAICRKDAGQVGS